MKEAGCYPCAIKVGISTSGSGQMQPLPMNELVKEQLEAVGFKVDLEPMDWNALIGVFLAGAKKYDYNAINFSMAPIDPVQGILKKWTTARGAAELLQLGLLQGRRDGRDGPEGAWRVRPGEAQRHPDRDERDAPSPRRRKCTSSMISTRARSRPNFGLRSGAELVPGSHADRGVALTDQGRRAAVTQFLAGVGRSAPHAGEA